MYQRWRCSKTCPSIGSYQIGSVHIYGYLSKGDSLFAIADDSTGADTVADIDMAPVIAAHAKRTAADPDVVMTVLLKPASRKHRIRSGGFGVVTCFFC